MTTKRTILNLGCGTRTSPDCLNIDWSVPLRLKKSRLGSRLACVVLRGERFERFKALSGDILVHDLRKGIPAPDASIDAVYHSHLLEHLDRSLVPQFLDEVKRVLKDGGIHRIVVPDLETGCRRYLAHLEASVAEQRLRSDHDGYVAAIIEQMVRREPSGTSQQPPLRRRLENLLLGDARRRGETHQWMYDRINLAHALDAAGFREIRTLTHTRSAIPAWDIMGLDRGDDGGEYRPGSLYMEAMK